MPEYLAPGVYVEEVSTGFKPIEGVSTNTAGMVGMTEKGTTIEKPILVTSFAQFKRKFGSYLPSNFGNHRFLAYAVNGFFQNGGKNIYIVKVKGEERELPNQEAYIGIDNGAGHRTGLQALQDIDQISIVAVPGITDTDVQRAMLHQCEKLKDRFTILDIPEHYKSISEVSAHRQNFDSKYGAVYHPWMKIFDPLEKRDFCIPPSGHIAGIYARTDSESGVHKAPANEIIKGIKGLKYGISNKENDLLNSFPNNINALRDFRKSGRGIRVWGAQTISSDSLWKYIPVRRLFLYVEEAIEKGTQWVVFEPNDVKLWVRVKQTISAFLTRLWREGAIMGIKAEEAFFVKCDHNTMTQDDIDNGRLVCVIGIAPVKPAEFVIFRIVQWSGGSEVTE